MEISRGEGRNEKYYDLIGKKRIVTIGDIYPLLSILVSLLAFKRVEGCVQFLGRREGKRGWVVVEERERGERGMKEG